MDMNLSIVVPIYNVESYLEACLNSIEPILSNENVELILVNDGSKDGSEDICYKYIDKISNTKHQIPNIYIRITKDCRRREIPE
ncbi:hypothetical protein TUM15786_07980 [Neisseria gonorrhoeae]|nr:hypothetical protein TUM15786_07980 [Neisseria gonorrhoeae]